MPEPFDPDAAETFRYVRWDYDDRSGVAVLTYELDGAGRFEEHFTFPHPERIDSGPAFVAALEVLFVCAGVSYYKAAAPTQVAGVPIRTRGFVQDLYLHGLAEYAMANGMEPIRPTIDTVGAEEEPVRRARARSGVALVAIGGGKDSIVSVESVRRSGREAVLGSVGTHRALAQTASVSQLEHLVIVRQIDPRLLSLNAQGARNGHVPVTAINSSALATLAAGLGLDAVVMSNESSASVPIMEYRGLPVNHQWSKSLECEQALARLLPVPYFSLLRPLHEVEICRRFAGLDLYFGVVTSCNQAYTARGRSAGLRWCGECPKCRFVFLGLAAFLDPHTVVGIFDGLDLLADQAAVEPYRAILGLGGEPPMECIGTTRESRWAMARLADSAHWRDRAVVRALTPSIDLVMGWDPLRERGPHQIPPDWLEVADALA